MESRLIQILLCVKPQRWLKGILHNVGLLKKKTAEETSDKMAHKKDGLYIATLARR